MSLHARGYDKAVRLVEAGVDIPDPSGLVIGDDVDIDRISRDRVTIWPGCRITGPKTVISAGCVLGSEGPVTLDDCRLGPGVRLKGGSFTRSVFLENAMMGPGAQVREGCLLEEGATGAHCVGLKQTILFPFVTLGSLINFCDCLMAGGTSREDHSEVGSSYVHFNYTPDGDKTTASLFGDVPRGVMLDQPAIFLGGQGGAVGPVRVGYGSVIAAGSVLRHDVLEDGKLVFDPPTRAPDRDRQARGYRGLQRVVRNNVVYLANLTALEHWYRKVRERFFADQELGPLVHEGALEMLSLAREERLKRLEAMAEKVPVTAPGGAAFGERARGLRTLFAGGPDVAPGDEFVTAFHAAASGSSGNYTETIRGLEPELRAVGVQWLDGIVRDLCARADDHLGSMDLFDTDR